MGVRPWVLAAIAVASLVVLAYPVNGNLRYEVGVHRASPFPVAETFSHRPVAFRLLTDALAWLPTLVSRAVTPDPFTRAVLFESGLRALCLVAAAAAAATLGLGLRRRGVAHAWGYALACYAALAFTAPATGEPDWWAATLAVAAVGAGLLGRPWLGGPASGVLLALCALVKISSLPVALAALLVLAVLDLRRGLVAGLAALLTGLAALGAMVLWAPHELPWLLDIRALQPDAWTPAARKEAGRYLGNLAARWPAIALLPAFFVGASRREAWTAAGVLALAGFGIAFQGQYYLYHAVALAAVAAALAVHTLYRSGTALVAPLLLASAWTLWIGTTPAGWRIAHEPELFALAAAWAIVLGVVQWRATRDGRRPVSVPGLVAAGLVATTFLATQTPTSAEYITTGATGQTPLTNRAQLRTEFESAERVHRVIGTDTPVTYLAFGSAAYTLQNPTDCRYPSPLFLQRPGSRLKVSDTTFAENLACLGEPTSRWLVWNRDWMHRKGLDPVVLHEIERYWACEQAVTVTPYTLCPRREAGTGTASAAD